MRTSMQTASDCAARATRSLVVQTSSLRAFELVGREGGRELFRITVESAPAARRFELTVRW